VRPFCQLTKGNSPTVGDPCDSPDEESRQIVRFPVVRDGFHGNVGGYLRFTTHHAIKIANRGGPGGWHVAQVNIDGTDEEIIRQLQVDGRRPYTQLAKAVGLSEAAVRQRVQRLLESEVMQVVAVTDPIRLGLQRQAMVAIKVEGDLRDVADELAVLDEVVYVVLTAGPTDLLAEVVVPNDEALFGLLNDRIRKIPGVVSTETSIYLSLRKQTYQWGIR